ncbi:hypothetical protein [Ramlibacter sp.]|uniref:hypothetical protein n=1 Tax=Ramlibacter sp. TaxID=1917967 RepID=UPI003D137344
MSTQLPDPTQFLASLGRSFRDDETLAVGHHLGEIHQYRRDPFMQAVAMARMWRRCQAFWRQRQNAPLRIPGTAPVPQQPDRTRLSSGGRQRSNGLVPMRTTHVFSEEATRVRAAVLERIERQLLKELCAILQCDVYALPNFLESRFFSGLTKHGVDTDAGSFSWPLKYMEQAEAAELRLTFRNGCAHALVREHDGVVERPADTRSNTKEPATKHRRYCFGYVLTGTDLLMADHRVYEFTHQRTFFHSSYLAGQQIVCAGDISFEQGRCTSISNLSGHYQPTEPQLMHVIVFLRSRGLDVSRTLIVLHSDADGDLEALSADDPVGVVDPRLLPEDMGNRFLQYRTANMFLQKYGMRG